MRRRLPLRRVGAVGTERSVSPPRPRVMRRNHLEAIVSIVRFGTTDLSDNCNRVLNTIGMIATSEKNRAIIEGDAPRTRIGGALGHNDVLGYDDHFNGFLRLFA